MPKYLIITAAQRAGTTAMAAAIGMTGHFTNYGEVFHDNPDRDGSFLEWARAKSLMWHEVQGYDRAKSIADDYLNYLSELNAGATPLLDIKFNSWTALTPAWSYPFQVPFFLRHLCEREAAFIVIRRRNLAEQILSEFVARATGKWHERTAADIGAAPVEVHPHDVGDRARSIIRSEQMVLRTIYTAGAPVLSLAFEDLFLGQLLQRGVSEFLRAQFGGEYADNLPIPIGPNATSKRDVVSNYDALSALVEEVERCEARWPF